MTRSWRGPECSVMSGGGYPQALLGPT